MAGHSLTLVTKHNISALLPVCTSSLRLVSVGALQAGPRSSAPLGTEHSQHPVQIRISLHRPESDTSYVLTLRYLTGLTLSRPMETTREHGPIILPSLSPSPYCPPLLPLSGPSHMEPSSLPPAPPCPPRSSRTPMPQSSVALLGTSYL